MQYLLLIYQNEAMAAQAPKEAMKPIMDGYMAFNEATKAAGQFMAGEALQPISTATTVRVRDGKTLTTDGPFAETKEQLGGFYMVQAKDLDEALELASRIPTAKTGCIEVRPIMNIEFD